MPLVALAAGRRLTVPGLTLDVLGPPHPVAHVDPDDGTAVNDGSLVVRAATPAGTVLLSGDAELAEQADILAAGQYSYRRTSSRCRTTAAGTAHRPSSLRSRRGWCW